MGVETTSMFFYHKRRCSVGISGIARAVETVRKRTIVVDKRI